MVLRVAGLTASAHRHLLRARREDKRPFFTRGRPDKGKPKHVWVYDLRSNLPSFGKRTPLTRAQPRGPARAQGGRGQCADEARRGHSRNAGAGELSLKPLPAEPSFARKASPQVRPKICSSTPPFWRSGPWSRGRFDWVLALSPSGAPPATAGPAAGTVAPLTTPPPARWGPGWWAVRRRPVHTGRRPPAAADETGATTRPARPGMAFATGGSDPAPPQSRPGW